MKARTKVGDTWSALSEATFRTYLTHLNDLNNQTSTCVSNYPNPVKAFTTIECYLPESGNAQLQILSLQGSVIESINLGYLYSGINKYLYNASLLGNGVYIYRIQCGKLKLNSKMTVVQ